MSRLRLCLVTVVPLLLSSNQAIGAEPVRIQVLDGHKGRAVKNEKVNVHVERVRGDVTYTTDANGIFTIEVDPQAEISVGTEWQITCYSKSSPAAKLFKVSHIIRYGAALPDTCGKIRRELIPGTLTIYSRKASLFENMAR